MSDDFIDSNVLVYLFDETEPRKFAVARGLVNDAILTGRAVISFQVVQEVLNLLTGKFSKPAAPHAAQNALQDLLLPLWRVMPSERALPQGNRSPGPLWLFLL